MDNIALYNQNGQKFDVDVVRYFKTGNNKYLIFSLNEIDHNGYIQLYVSKVEKENNNDVMKNITDENEWANFKNDIQKIVSNNRNNIANNGDLDYKELDGATVNEFRIFKLKEDVAKSLGENKNVKKTEEVVEPIPEIKPIRENVPKNLEAASANDTGLTIEEILRQVSEGAKNAREVSKLTLDEEVKPEKKLTIDDLLKSATPAKDVEDVEYTEEERKFMDAEPKVIASDTYIPPVEEKEAKDSEEDYELKYKDSLKIIQKLEDENMQLINELVEAKAKLSTIKDIIS